MTTELLHELRVCTTTEEKVDEKFVIEGLFAARQKTWAVLHEIREALCVGLTEDDARKLALDIFGKHGVSKHWHKPYIRFGQGTALTFHEPLQKDYKLVMGDPLYIDLGPVWPDLDRGLDYEGDVGDTFILGENPAALHCANTARQIFLEAREQWQKNCTGEELYCFLKERAEHYGYRLAENVDGHRIANFPHHQYSRKRLAQVTFAPSASLWVLEIQIISPDMSFGAFFEDLLT